jgi:serine/threonine protein kinase
MPSYGTYEIDKKPEINDDSEFRFKKGVKVYQHLNVVAHIGEGGVGEIFSCKEPNSFLSSLGSRSESLESEEGGILALKRFHSMAKERCEIIMYAIDYVRKVEHDGIAKIYDAYYFDKKYKNNKVTRHLYVVMPFYQHGDLRRYMDEHIEHNQAIPEDIIKKLMVQLLSALQFLHSQQPNSVIHRDISPDNVMIDDRSKNSIKVVLADFDLAREIEGRNDGNYSMQLGKPYYWAPEVAYGEKYGVAVDLYSLGVVCYELITLEKPTLASPKDGHPQAIASLLKEFNEDGKIIAELREKMKVSRVDNV